MPKSTGTYPPTGLLDLSGWPEAMRVIVRAERPHPGAQLRFTDVNGNRLTAFATNTKGGQLPDLELRHRRRARREDRIRNAKKTGLRKPPLHDLSQNQSGSRSSRYSDFGVGLSLGPTCPETVTQGQLGRRLGCVVSVGRVLQLGGWVTAVFVSRWWLNQTIRPGRRFRPLEVPDRGA
jgi:hypothetical protein